MHPEVRQQFDDWMARKAADLKAGGLGWCRIACKSRVETLRAMPQPRKHRAFACMLGGAATCCHVGPCLMRSVPLRWHSQPLLPSTLTLCPLSLFLPRVFHATWPRSTRHWRASFVPCSSPIPYHALSKPRRLPVPNPTLTHQATSHPLPARVTLSDYARDRGQLRHSDQAPQHQCAYKRTHERRRSSRK